MGIKEIRILDDRKLHLDSDYWHGVTAGVGEGVENALLRCFRKLWSPKEGSRGLWEEWESRDLRGFEGVETT